MKQLKPFKVGATYKLRREMAGEIEITLSMIKYGYSVERLISKGFTANVVVGGDVFHAQDDVIACVIASVNERHMFYRVDNKKPRK